MSAPRELELTANWLEQLLSDPDVAIVAAAEQSLARLQQRLGAALSLVGADTALRRAGELPRDSQVSEWDPSIAALIAKLDSWAETCRNPPCDFDRPQPFIAQLLESAASALALTSHVWDRNAPTVPYLGQMLQQDIDVARTFNESSDPRAMLAFIKLLAVGRAQPPSALRGVRVTTDHRQREAKAALFIELLRYTSHRDRCVFHSHHTTDCRKWAGFHEARYLDPQQDCTCGADAPCSCGLEGARAALLLALGVDGGPREMPMPDMPATLKDEPDKLARASGDLTAASALRGVRVTKNQDQDHEGLPGTTGQGYSLEPTPRRENEAWTLRSLLTDYRHAADNDLEWYWVDQVEARIKALERGSA